MKKLSNTDDVIKKEFELPQASLSIVSGRWPIVSILLAVLLVSSIVFSYLQYTFSKTASDKVNSLNIQNASLSNDNKRLNSQLNNTNSQLTVLQGQYNNLKSSTVTMKPTKTIDQSALTLSVSSVQYVNPFGSVTASATYLGVRLIMTNSTDEDISMDPGLFKIMDSQSNIYNDFGFGGATNFPDGWGANTLQSQTIASGKSITGNLTFMTANDKLTRFTLVNLTKSYPINLDQ